MLRLLYALLTPAAGNCSPKHQSWQAFTRKCEGRMSRQVLRHLSLRHVLAFARKAFGLAADTPILMLLLIDEAQIAAGSFAQPPKEVSRRCCRTRACHLAVNSALVAWPCCPDRLH